MRPTRVVLILLAFGVPATAIASTVVFDSFGGGNSVADFGYGIGSRDTVTDKNVFAAQFVPRDSYLLDRLDLALQPFCCGETNLLITISADSDGEPGSPLETFRSQVQAEETPIDFQVIRIASSNHPALTARTAYWVMTTVAADAGFLGWRFGVIGDSGLLASQTGTEPWTVFAGTLPAFRIAGTAIASEIPEPGSFILVLVGLLILRMHSGSRADSKPGQ